MDNNKELLKKNFGSSSEIFKNSIKEKKRKSLKI